MEILARLVFGHLLADFTFQTNYIANWKRQSFAGLLVHVAIHPVCYIVLTFPYINEIWATFGSVSLNGWTSIFIITFLHFIEDFFRINMVNRGWPDNTLFYLWDQVVHLIIIWFICPVKTQPLESIFPILGILFVIVTHFATVTIWFIEKDVYGRDYPQTEEKYLSIIQRLVVWLAFFLPHPLWIFVVLFLLGTFGRHVWKRHVDYTWASVILGNVIAVACGLVTRFGLNYHI